MPLSRSLSLAVKAIPLMLLLLLLRTYEVSIVMSLGMLPLLCELLEIIKGTALLCKEFLLISRGLHFQSGLLSMNVNLAFRM